MSRGKFFYKEIKSIRGELPITSLSLRNVGSHTSWYFLSLLPRHTAGNNETQESILRRLYLGIGADGGWSCILVIVHGRKTTFRRDNPYMSGGVCIARFVVL